MSGVAKEGEGEVSEGVHPTAIIDPGAELGAGVSIGPWSLIGPGVVIGEGTRIGPSAMIERDTQVGRDCVIAKGAVLGTDPQDLKFDGERTELVIGDRTVIREYATLNRGTSALGRTVVGSDCMLMAYTHVAHDCVLGDHVILSNAVNMAGHVEIGDWAIVGGVTAIHQFVKVGSHAFVGGASRISQDVPPYCRVAGNPSKLYGLNSVGLERRGFSTETRALLKRAYRILFLSKERLSAALDTAREEVGGTPEVDALLDFIAGSERGVSL